LLVWQPFWKSARKMKLKLLDGPAMRKKAVVSLARQLALICGAGAPAGRSGLDLPLVGLPWVRKYP